MEARQRPKKKAGHPRLAAGRFQKQGNLLARLVSGGHEMCRPTLTSRIFKSLYRGLDGVQSGITTFRRFSTVSHYLKPVTLKMEWRAEVRFQGQQRGWGVFDCPPAVRGSTGDHILLMTFRNSDEVRWPMKFTRLSLPELFLTECSKWESLLRAACLCLPFVCCVCRGHIASLLVHRPPINPPVEGGRSQNHGLQSVNCGQDIR